MVSADTRPRSANAPRPFFSPSQEAASTPEAATNEAPAAPPASSQDDADNVSSTTPAAIPPIEDTQLVETPPATDENLEPTQDEPEPAPELEAANDNGIGFQTSPRPAPTDRRDKDRSTARSDDHASSEFVSHTKTKKREATHPICVHSSPEFRDVQIFWPSGRLAVAPRHLAAQLLRAENKSAGRNRTQRILFVVQSTISFVFCSTGPSDVALHRGSSHMHMICTSPNNSGLHPPPARVLMRLRKLRQSSETGTTRPRLGPAAASGQTG